MRVTLLSACHLHGLVFSYLTSSLTPAVVVIPDDFNPNTRQEQIDDLAAMSREYERQETVRMAGNNGNFDSRSEPYINEIIPVHTRSRRRSVEPRESLRGR